MKEKARENHKFYSLVDGESLKMLEGISASTQNLEYIKTDDSVLLKSHRVGRQDSDLQSSGHTNSTRDKLYKQMNDRSDSNNKLIGSTEQSLKNEILETSTKASVIQDIFNRKDFKTLAQIRLKAGLEKNKNHPIRSDNLVPLKLTSKKEPIQRNSISEVWNTDKKDFLSKITSCSCSHIFRSSVNGKKVLPKKIQTDMKTQCSRTEKPVRKIRRKRNVKNPYPMRVAVPECKQNNDIWFECNFPIRVSIPPSICVRNPWGIVHMNMQRDALKLKTLLPPTSNNAVVQTGFPPIPVKIRAALPSASARKWGITVRPLGYGPRTKVVHKSKSKTKSNTRSELIGIPRQSISHRNEECQRGELQSSKGGNAVDGGAQIKLGSDYCKSYPYEPKDRSTNIKSKREYETPNANSEFIPREPRQAKIAAEAKKSHGFNDLLDYIRLPVNVKNGHQISRPLRKPLQSKDQESVDMAQKHKIINIVNGLQLNPNSNMKNFCLKKPIGESQNPELPVPHQKNSHHSGRMDTICQPESNRWFKKQVLPKDRAELGSVPTSKTIDVDNSPISFNDRHKVKSSQSKLPQMKNVNSKRSEFQKTYNAQSKRPLMTEPESSLKASAYPNPWASSRSNSQREKKEKTVLKLRKPTASSNPKSGYSHNNETPRIILHQNRTNIHSCIHPNQSDNPYNNRDIVEPNSKFEFHKLHECNTSPSISFSQQVKVLQEQKQKYLQKLRELPQSELKPQLYAQSEKNEKYAKLLKSLQQDQQQQRVQKVLKQQKQSFDYPNEQKEQSLRQHQELNEENTKPRKITRDFYMKTLDKYSIQYMPIGWLNFGPSKIPNYNKRNQQK
ncbi:uncharacterized protein LOC116806238 [Drosophila grimshawi]|uniref:uncharacterized protein LOC116806238 n=1 Tax=Drosophila grimshawi TaxID=7222 RepID=UPI000C8702C3|nr:uncharacterized protein LOC116806238 [Drosophila grimshawi]